MRLPDNWKPNTSFDRIFLGTTAAFVICYLVGFVSAPFLSPQVISVSSLSRKLPIVENAFEYLKNANAEVSADRLLFTAALFSVIALVSAVLMFFLRDCVAKEGSSF